MSGHRHLESEELRNAINGSIAGAVIGLLYGIATLSVIGLRFIPGLFGASLILGYSAFGGFLFGAIIGSTGLFARQKGRHKSIASAHIDALSHSAGQPRSSS